MWEDLLSFVAIGFAAQMIDGALGMAYGVSSTSAMLAMGVPPATASACVHAAETFTTAASGASHWRLGNVDKDLVWRLAIPGMIGGGIGAYLLGSVLDGEMIKPYVNAYLLILGVFILTKAFRNRPSEAPPPSQVAPLGFVGGLLDSIGGGGWGAIVASTLVGHGVNPRYAIGSVNLAEFFVTFVISGTFFATIGLELWPIISGLIIGGVLAAPLAAYTTKYIPEKVLMIAVGAIVVALSVRGIARALA